MEVQLSRGYVAVIDDEDAHLVEGKLWHSTGPRGSTVYAICQDGTPLHRLIAGAKRGQVVDHADGEGLNNRRSNLRVCSHVQNMQNRKAAAGAACRFKGVTVAKDYRAKPYRAEIEAFGERMFLGSFLTDVEAAKAYDRAARIFHGKFARTNADLGLLAA